MIHLDHKNLYCWNQSCFDEWVMGTSPIRL